MRPRGHVCWTQFVIFRCTECPNAFWSIRPERALGRLVARKKGQPRRESHAPAVNG